MTSVDGRVDVLDLAMTFGCGLFGHGAAREVLARVTHPGADQTGAPAAEGIAAPGLGDLSSHALRAEACAALCAWAAPVWGAGDVPAHELSALVLHSGSEAVETALKTCIRATGRDGLVAFQGAYHGTFGLALAVTHGAHFRESFTAQYADTVRFEPYGVVPELDQSVACVIVEPVQGRAGVVTPPAGFLAGLRAECTRVGAQLVLDDVLVGCGRLRDPLPGADAAPDVICLGKALGSGVAASAVVARAALAAQAWAEGEAEPRHTSTLIGDPVAAAGTLQTLRFLAMTDLAGPGELWRATLAAAAEELDVQVRGAGLLWAVESREATPGSGVRLADAMLAQGVLTVPSGPEGRSITIYPSLVHDDLDAQTFRRALAGALRDTGL